MAEYLLILNFFFFTPALDFSVTQTYQHLHYSQVQCESALEEEIDKWQKKYLKDDEVAPVGIEAKCVEV